MDNVIRYCEHKKYAKGCHGTNNAYVSVFTRLF